MEHRFERWAIRGLMLVFAGLLAGCAGSSPSSTANNQTAAPVFSPGGGTYTTTQTVAISSATAGAVLYCTTDGTTPTISSPQCALPTTVFKSEYLQALAVAPGMTASTVASSGYTINLNTAPAPSFSPAGGTYLSPQSVTITDAVAGANLYYTTDGTIPTASSKLYTAPIPVSSTQTVNAIAVASNFNNSSVASATYTFGTVAAPPTFSIPGGSYTTPQQVGLGDATSGATIYYTVDGTTPTTSSMIYHGVPIAVSKSVTINALAAASGYASSGVVSATYVINLAPAPPPTFSLTLASLSIADTAAGATIYYTTDGSQPTTSSKVYTGPITVTQGEIIQALAVASNYLNSSVSGYTVNFPKAATPDFSLSLVTLSMTESTPGATIYYTIDGSMPTTGSLVYSNPFTVTPGETVNAIAAGPGLVVSGVASLTIPLPSAPQPTVSPAGGLTSTVPLTITLSDVSGTTIYYTTDGSTPTVSPSELYSGPFTVSSTSTVKAIAVAPNASNSPVVSANYTIAAGNTALSGKVMSGTSLVKGAAVQLYAAGQSGYGSSGAALLAQAITTDTSGAFNFTFNCPAAPGDLVYMVATGGDSGSGPNANIKLMTPLGSCNDITNTAKWTPSVIANEVTTIASAYALSGFASIDTTNGGIDIGAPDTYSATAAPQCNAAGKWQSLQHDTCNYLGLGNAFKTAMNLVDVTHGAVWGAATGASWHAASSGVTATGMTPAYAATPGTVARYLNDSSIPTARINALADMLATCVQSSGSGCTALFSAATTTTPTSVTPADTLQVALNIALNPGNNVATLLGLVPTSNPPYATTNLVLSGTNAPADLTLALTFTGAGLGIGPDIEYAGNTLSDGNSLIANSAIAVDSAGNIWVGAYRFDAFNFVGTGDMIAKFNSLGEPLTPATTVSAGTATYGGYNPQPSLTSNHGINLLAIDQSDNVWAIDGQSSVLEISSNPSPSLTHTYTANSVFSIAIDAAGDAWAGGGGGSAGNLYKYQPNSAAGINYSGIAGVRSFVYLDFDSNGGLWAGANVPSGVDILQLSNSTGSITYNAFPTTAGRGSSTLVSDSSGNVYGCDPTGLKLDVFNTAAATAPNLLVHSYPLTTQRACGTQLVLDGQGHLFAVLVTPNGAFPGGTRFIANIDEYTTSGTLLSPVAKGYTGSSSTEPPTLNPDALNFLPLSGVGAAVDGSGNLWVLNFSTAGSNASDTDINPGNVLVEYIGIGAPVVTPVSTALTTGLLGVRP